MGLREIEHHRMEMVRVAGKSNSIYKILQQCHPINNGHSSEIVNVNTSDTMCIAEFTIYYFRIHKHWKHWTNIENQIHNSNGHGPANGSKKLNDLIKS